MKNICFVPYGACELRLIPDGVTYIGDCFVPYGACELRHIKFEAVNQIYVSSPMGRVSCDLISLKTMK